MEFAPSFASSVTRSRDVSYMRTLLVVNVLPAERAIRELPRVRVIPAVNCPRSETLSSPSSLSSTICVTAGPPVTFTCDEPAMLMLPTVRPLAPATSIREFSER